LTIKTPNDDLGDHMKKFTLLASTLLLVAACERQGPLERVGEEIDEAVEDVKAGGETTANKIDDVIDDVQETAEDVRKDLE